MTPESDSRAERSSLFSLRYRDAEGEIVTVPLHDCEVVRDGRVHARFRQNGYFTSRTFADEVRALVPVDDDVEDLGAALDA